MHAIENIVAPTDFSDLSRAALRQAVSMARIDGAAVHLVHALRAPLLATSYDVSVPAVVWEAFRKTAHEQIEGIRAELEAAGVAQVTTEVAEARNPVATIERAVSTHDADLVVMGTHGFGGFKHAMLGSVCERTIRTVEVPVLAVKGEPDEEAAIGRILLAVDFSADSDEATEVAAVLAARLGASVDAMHVIEFVADYSGHLSAESRRLEKEMQQDAAKDLERTVARISKEGVAVEPAVPCGSPAATISAEAERLGADLIVIGTRGQTGLKHFLLGSVAERTLRMAPCSVLVVKSSEQPGHV